MNFFNKKEEHKVYLVLLIFFILGIILILTKGDSLYLGDFNLMNNDDVKYLRSAWTLIEENRFVYHDVQTPSVFIMPGYTFILSFFICIFGKINGIIAIRLFQVILQVISLYLIYKICREIFNSKVAFITLILSVLYAPEILTPGLILTETVFRFLLILLIYISIKGLTTKKLVYYTLGGIVWGLAVLIRPTIGLYPILILLIMIIYKYSLKEIILRSLIVLSIFMAILTPWAVRNYVTFNRFIPLTLSSGNPFLQGTYIHYDRSKDYIPYESSTDAIKRNQIELDVGKERLKTFVPDNKLAYIYWYTIGKSVYYWAVPFYYPDLINFPLSIAIIYHVILLILALGSFIIRKYNGFKYNNKQGLILVVSIIAYFNLIYLPYYTFSRYAYPTMCFVIMFAANTIYFIYSKRKHRKT